MQGGTPDVGDEYHPASADDDHPRLWITSCQGCRRRKLRCSRDLPTCTHCHRLDAPCVYDNDKRNKPGLKTGAVESLNRRIEAIEHALTQIQNTSDGGSSGTPQHTQNTDLVVSQDTMKTLSTLCLELCKLNARNTPSSAASRPPARRPSVVSPISSSSWQLDANESDRLLDSVPPQSRKRRRLDSCGNPTIGLQVSLEDVADASTSLPSPELLEDIVNMYFAYIQPWVPIFHETHFRRRIHDHDELPRLVIILHAMVVAAMRFANPKSHGLSPEEVDIKVRQSRGIVVLNAMEHLSVENLQALIIVAFDDIGNGQESRAWSIIGSLTRTVEYLQLSVENDHRSAESALKRRLSSLPPPKSWVEEEERRRVFWNIFNLDRFCSVFTGWNTSLTADDVHRRLPADGGLWHKEEPVITPFFGIWTRSEAKLGNSIAFLPAHYPSPEQNVESVAHSDSPTSTTHAARNSAQIDMSTVGAFAYCIEATESLSQVTTYFLQQRINFFDRKEVGSWLTRFKELDLRLVHWKMFLPDKWKDSNISRQPTLINMDPNLTLAHLTHNTSMILLHQRIAYPQAEWRDIVKLPSLCSAETCQNAAIETQNIAEKYLKYSHGLVTNQFTFCVFVAARVLLVHWRYYGTELVREFWSLIGCLDEMAARWLGEAYPDSSQRRCLAGTFAERLRDLHQRCTAGPDFSLDVFAYSTVVSNWEEQVMSPPKADSATRSDHDSHRAVPTSPTTNSSSRPVQNSQLWEMVAGHRNPELEGDLTKPTNRLSEGYNYGRDGIRSGQMPLGSTEHGPLNDIPTDELSSISYMLLDQSFMDLDRVITLEDMMFTAIPPSANVAAITNGVGNTE